jgi:broad specificity phosphatase PhoE
MAQILFTLARHGRTAGNDKNLYRGWSNEDFAQLDANGRNDAREAAYFILGTGMKFPLILADDLGRTQETAQILAEILGVKEIVTDKRLRPIDVGDFTGKNKDKNPLDEYMKNRSKKIPGGENLSEFDKRQTSVFADILELVTKIHQPVLVVGHGSNASYLYHKVNKGGKEVGYEGITKPGGASIFTKDGLAAIFKKREGAPQPYKDGTTLSGYVTPEENKPPRECDDCKWFQDKNDGCKHPLVQIDPELQSLKQNDGSIKVNPKGCCDNFQSKKD